MNKIWVLFKKELMIEWRQKYALNGMLLYLVTTLYVAYQGFKARGGSIEANTWNTLFWIVMLFNGVNAVAKSFFNETPGRSLYMYTVAKAEHIIVAKMAYNAGIMLVISLLQLAIYSVLMGNPVQNMGLYLATTCLGAVGFSLTLTMVAGVAIKANNSHTLMAILSFPLVLPLLLVCMKLAKQALDGLEIGYLNQTMMMLLGLNVMVSLLSYVLFPYLWRS